MRTIKCAHCGKILFETNKSNGAAINDAQRLGFIGKIPFLYGISGVVFFCSKEHCSQWFKENTTQEARNNADKAIFEFKAKQPQMVEHLANAASRLQQFVNKVKSGEIKLSRK